MKKTVEMWCIIFPNGEIDEHSPLKGTRKECIEKRFYPEQWKQARKRGYTCRKVEVTIKTKDE